MPIFYRPHHLSIDIAKPDSQPIISLKVQRLEMEGGAVKAITGHQGRIYRRAIDIPTETVNFHDPVTGLTGSISVAGLDSVLKQFSNRWAAESLSLQIDPDTGWPRQQ